MPLVHIDMMEGRSEESVERMVVAVSEAISTTLEAPIESIRVVVNEMKPHQYAVAGKPWRVVAAERAAAKGGTR